MRRLLLILLLALSLRLTWAFVQPATDAAIDALPDQREYLSLGRNLLQHHALRFDDPRFHQTIYAYRLPGYPLFVAACGGSVRVVRVVQSLVDTSTVLAVYAIARRMGLPRSAAEIAAAMVAVNPFMIYFSGSVLTETLFTASVTWGVWGLCPNTGLAASAGGGEAVASRCPLKRPARYWFSLFTILATLLRPTAVILFPAVALGVPGPILTRLKRAATALVLIAITLAPWSIRNHARLGHWIFTSTNDGVTLYDGFNPAATGASDQRFFDQMPAELSMSEYDRSRSLRRRAVDWAIRNPGTAVTLAGRKILRGWSPVPLSQDFSRPFYRIVAAGYAVPFDMAVLIGLYFGRLKRSQKWLLVLPALGVTLAQVLSVGSIRYRIPAEPPMAVIAAVGLTSIANSKRRQWSVVRGP